MLPRMFFFCLFFFKHFTDAHFFCFSHPEFVVLLNANWRIRAGVLFWGELSTCYLTSSESSFHFQPKHINLNDSLGSSRMYVVYNNALIGDVGVYRFTLLPLGFTVCLCMIGLQ